MPCPFVYVRGQLGQIKKMEADMRSNGAGNTLAESFFAGKARGLAANKIGRGYTLLLLATAVPIVLYASDQAQAQSVEAQAAVATCFDNALKQEFACGTGSQAGAQNNTAITGFHPYRIAEGDLGNGQLDIVIGDFSNLRKGPSRFHL